MSEQVNVSVIFGASNRNTAAEHQWQQLRQSSTLTANAAAAAALLQPFYQRQQPLHAGAATAIDAVQLIENKAYAVYVLQQVLMCEMPNAIAATVVASQLLLLQQQTTQQQQQQHHQQQLLQLQMQEQQEQELQSELFSQLLGCFGWDEWCVCARYLCCRVWQLTCAAATDTATASTGVAFVGEEKKAVELMEKALQVQQTMLLMHGVCVGVGKCVMCVCVCCR